MIVIIDYGMGNLYSVAKALRRIGAEAIISSKKEDIERADKLILPGVGHFKKGMENLKNLNLIELLNKKVLDKKTPILGICLGLQLFSRHSEEGEADGFGWLDAETIKFKLEDKFRIPHMGWNNIKIKKKSAIFPETGDSDSFYFVHSYHVNCKDKSNILAISNYGIDFVSAIVKNNIFGVQFHPEKSHSTGLKLLKNFVNYQDV